MNLDTQKLDSIVSHIFQPGKGILAADESTRSTPKRLDPIGLENTEANRQRFRDLLLSAEGIEQHLSGVILHDETFWQDALDGQKFTEKLSAKGVIPGIKVDAGLVDLPNHPGEKFTAGLDGLDARMEKYAAAGAGFAKWRSVFAIDPAAEIPSKNSIRITSNIFALYAGICQRNGVVPIVEPEVLMDGPYTMEQKFQTMKYIFQDMFMVLKKNNVYLPGVILKTSFVHPGSQSEEYAEDADVFAKNAELLSQYVPAELGGIVFLSGGLSGETATKYLRGAVAACGDLGAKMTFSFARGIQMEPIMIWEGKDEKVADARWRYGEILGENGKASQGQ